jgi:hypothetical protein
VLPKERDALQQYCRNNPAATLIFKAPNMCEGKGTHLLFASQMLAILQDNLKEFDDNPVLKDVHSRITSSCVVQVSITACYSYL